MTRFAATALEVLVLAVAPVARAIEDQSPAISRPEANHGSSARQIRDVQVRVSVTGDGAAIAREKVKLEFDGRSQQEITNREGKAWFTLAHVAVGSSVRIQMTPRGWQTFTDGFPIDSREMEIAVALTRIAQATQSGGIRQVLRTPVAGVSVVVKSLGGVVR